MRRLCVAAALLAGSVAGWGSDKSLTSVDDVVEAHVRALGGLEKIHAIHGFVSHGTYNEDDLHIKTYVAQERPFYRVIGSPAKRLTSIHEGYDGSAWEYYPDPGIVVRTVGAAAAATRHTALLFDDVLVEPGVHGTTLTLKGKSELAGRKVYIVRAMLADGEERNVYVDAETFMIDAYDHVVPFHAFGAKAATRSEFGDYRSEGGVMWSHSGREVNLETGKVLTYGTVESVEINPAFEPGHFSPPEWDRTLLQQMVQRIYDERDEAKAVMATYADFRQMPAMKDVATADAVDFVGYQCLKMGHVDSAVALLAANVRDNPASARAHFGYGRALQEAKRVDDARVEFATALRIDPNFLRARTALDALK
jgi:Tetratricopeptide repeat